MRYGILSSESITDLERAVNKYIEDGWTPLGGVSIGFIGKGLITNYTEYCQAMIKEQSLIWRGRNESILDTRLRRFSMTPTVSLELVKRLYHYGPEKKEIIK